MSFSTEYLKHAATVASQLDAGQIEAIVARLVKLRADGGRLFILGVGGSAGNASHAVNDFRKLCGIECYSPIDNASELTARTNDEGWETVFDSWLKVSSLRSEDALLIFSVGGGDKERGISVNLIRAIDLAKERGASVISIVGKSTGYAANNSDIAIVVPEVDPALITPLSEAFQVVIWHGLVSHPDLQVMDTVW